MQHAPLGIAPYGHNFPPPSGHSFHIVNAPLGDSVIKEKKGHKMEDVIPSSASYVRVLPAEFCGLSASGMHVTAD